MKWIDEAKKDESRQTTILSFQEYSTYLEANPSLAVRPTYHYLLDMLDSFGRDEKKRFKLFEVEHPDSPAICGQQYTMDAIYHNLINFQDEGYNNKFILLVGPNGSAKSSIVRKIMKGAELYSETPEGTLHSFSWIFPADNIVKGSLGFDAEGKKKATKKEQESYAHLEDKFIAAIIPSELKDHPLLLIPLKYRQKIIEKLLKHDSSRLESIKKSYLYLGDLSKRNRLIYDALLASYKGNHEEVLRHIRVERFSISSRYSVGAVTIEPQLHVDAQIQQITMDRRLASLPPSLQSLNLFSLQGEVVMANRGILEYSDLLKRPLDTFKYLMMTAETGNINMSGILTELDIFFVGTSNEIHLSAFKQHPDFNSFKGRFNFIRVPYLLNYKDEARIYRDQLAMLEEKTSFEPHTIDALSMFSVMTRVRPCQLNAYSDQKLGEIAASLTPIEKIRFLGEGTTPERLDSEARQILKQGEEEIIQEYAFDEVYEGKFGISPRDVQQIIYKLGSKSSTVTFLDVIEYLDKRFLPKRSSFDFLNIPPQGEYHDHKLFLETLRSYFLSRFDSELRASLGLIDARSYEDHIKRYITNINALLKNEKLKNKITGKFEGGDTYFITEFEATINLMENAEQFRSHLISKLGAYALDNPKKEIVYTEVFPDLVARLQESFRQEQQKIIKIIAKNLLYFESEELPDREKSSPLDKEDREIISTVVGNLVQKFKYSKQGAIILLRTLIKERY